MASSIYPSFKTGLMKSLFSLDGVDTIKVVLVTGYTYNAAHTKWSDVQSYEITGTGYTKGSASVVGGVAITTSVVQNGNSPPGANFNTSGAASWTDATLTTSGAILVDSSAGGGANSLLIAWIDFVTPQSSSQGTFSVNWATSSNVIATFV